MASQSGGCVSKLALARLKSELRRLQRLSNLGFELRVIWVPDGCSRLSGEVRDGVIYIYEEDYAKALETLKHEFFDYAISQVIEPYRQVTNRLIALINDEAYKRKERLVRALARIF